MNTAACYLSLPALLLPVLSAWLLLNNLHFYHQCLLIGMLRAVGSLYTLYFWAAKFVGG